MPTLDIEKTYAGKLVAGVDEAGRGPWAGPVVAAAVIIPPEFCADGINDSKKLSAKKRNDLFQQIINNCQYGVGIVSEAQIDELNILQATKLAMSNAITNLQNKPQVVLVDGNQKFDAHGALVIPIVKGDSISTSIAAASIIAKVTRDTIMTDLHQQFPHYGWESNAGYGTATHIAAIEQHGICQHHRRSYAPIRKIIEAAG